MPTELFSRLHGAEADAQELLWVLNTHFGRAQADPAGGVAYPNLQEPRIVVRVKGEAITDILAGPDFDQTEFDSLGKLVEEKLIEGQGEAVHTAVLFSSSPVTGYFRAPNDAFQILPAPPEAPRPPAVMGDHPFLFEVPIRTSPDGFITGHRWLRSVSEWVWLLNALLVEQISGASARPRQMWVICPGWEQHAFATEPRWGQEMYFIPGWHGGTSNQLTPRLDAPPIPTRPANDYYSQRGTSAGDPFDLPDSFGADVNRFQQLEIGRRSRFLRAGQWIAAAAELWDRHISSWYIAQVAAIETLAHQDASPDLCSECGRDKNQRPTAQFKDFLTRYAPHSGTRTAMDQLYSVRSGLVHGGALLLHDSPAGSGLLAFAANEREPMERLSRSVSVAMVNWLRDQR